MLDFMFGSVLGDATTSTASTVTPAGFAICSIASIVLGACIALIYMYKHKYSKNFVVTLALMPLIVQVVILLVNGNLGAGIAVMGVFNLVRFRSIPGSAKDIGSVFLAMAVGLATGMGYIGIAVLLTLLIAIFNVIYVSTSFGTPKQPSKTLKITVPEDLEYESAFDNVLDEYTTSHELVSVQTSNMGSLFQIEYTLQMCDSASEKQMLDHLRCLNGNLKIVLTRTPSTREVL